jgi:hypothetical protein
MLVPTPIEDTYIRDYRYTQRNGERMFNYAQYVGSGTWKTGNDSELKAQANYYMKYGPKFGDYGIASHFFSPDVKVRLIIIWLLLLSISTVTVVMLFRTYTKTKTK